MDTSGAMIYGTNPEQTGVGQWCSPGPAAEQQKVWLLVFEDRDRKQLNFTNEDAAYAALAKSESSGWNCHLFESSPRVRDKSQLLKEIPKLPAGIVKHPELGELYDRLQVQQYAVKHCETLCAILREL